MHFRAYLIGTIGLLLLVLAGLHNLQAQTATPEPVNDIMVNGELLDTDLDGLPDYWYGLKLGTDDNVKCKPDQPCKFRFRGDSNQGFRALSTSMDALVPAHKRFNFITQINADNVAPGSFIQIIGFFNDLMTLNYVWMIPSGKVKDQILVSAVAAGGVNKLYLVVQIHGGNFKFDTASLIVDEPPGSLALPP